MEPTFKKLLGIQLDDIDRLLACGFNENLFLSALDIISRTSNSISNFKYNNKFSCVNNLLNQNELFTLLNNHNLYIDSNIAKAEGLYYIMVICESARKVVERSDKCTGTGYWIRVSDRRCYYRFALSKMTGYQQYTRRYFEVFNDTGRMCLNVIKGFE